MINTYHTSMHPAGPMPPPVPPRLGMGGMAVPPAPRPLSRISCGVAWCLALVLGLHIVLSMAGFIYLAHRQDKVLQGQEHLDDVIVLKRLQQCDDDTADVPTLLDCKKTLDKFRSVILKVSQTERRASMLIGDQYRITLAHMEVLETKGVPCRYKNASYCALTWNLEHSRQANVETVGDSRLRITEAGYYYVYSQVTFSIKKPPASPENIIRHVRRKPSKVSWEGPTVKDDILLRAYCPAGITMPCTSSQGGVYSLEKDDELYIEVTDQSWVSYETRNTFFGLYKL